MEFVLPFDFFHIEEWLAIWAGHEQPAEHVYNEIQTMKQLIEFRISRVNAMSLTASSAGDRYRAVKLMYLILEARSFEMEGWFCSLTEEMRAADDMDIDYARRYWGVEATMDMQTRFQCSREDVDALIEGLRQGDVPAVLASYQGALEAELAVLHTVESQIAELGLEVWWGQRVERGVTVHWDLNRQLFQEARAQAAQQQYYAPAYSSSAVVSSAGSAGLESAVEYVDSAIQELETYVFQTHGVQSYAAIGY